MKKYDIEKIKEKEKGCNLNAINPDDIPELKDIKIDKKTKGRKNVELLITSRKFVCIQS